MAISKINGVDVTTASTIFGLTGFSKINGIDLVSGGGGPTFTPVFSDNFSGAGNGSPLGDRAGWDDVSAGLITIDPGLVRPAGSASLFASINTDTYNSDQYSEFEFTGVGDGGAYAIGLSVRNQVGDTGRYDLVYFGTGVLDLSLNYRPNGGGGGGTIANIGRTYASGDKLRLYVTGAGAATRLFVQENIASGGWTDIATLSNQNPAVDLDGGVTGAVGYGSSSSISFDNFVSGNVT